MTRLRSGLATLLSLGLIACGLTAAPKLTSLVPAGAPMVVHVRSITDLRSAWKTTSFAKAWLDPEIRAFFAPTIERMNDGEDGPFAALTRETGLAPEDLLALFSGEAIIAVKDFGGGADKPQVLMAVECGAGAGKFLEILEKTMVKSAQSGGREVTEEFQGETIHVTMRPTEGDTAPPSETLVWALVDGILVAGEARAVVQEAIVAIKRDGVADPLTDHPSFASLYRKSPDTHLVVHLGLESILSAAMEAVGTQKGPEGQPVGPGAMLAQLGLNPQDFLQKLGLDALRSLDLSVAFRERGTVVEGDLSWTEQRGLLRIAAMGGPPAPHLPFIPESWVLASVDNYSLREGYAALMATLADVNPSYEALARGQIGKTGAQLGLDIERDLIGSMGDLTIAGYALPPGPAAPGQPLDQLIGISLSNADALRGAIDALINRVPVGRLLQTRDYLGETVRTLSLPQGKSFTFAITRDYFLLSIGSPAMVESAIQGMQNGGAAKPFWKRTEVARALDTLPDGASSIMVADLGRVMSLVVDFLIANTAKSQAAGQAATDDEAQGPKPTNTMPIQVDPAARPSVETIAKYWSMMSRGIYRTPQGFHLHLVIDHGL